jgi:ketosteroid isomerase-like protein
MQTNCCGKQLMKRLLYTTVFFVVCLVASAQSKQEQALVERTLLLSRTVFGTKDILALEDLFAKKVSYGHSSGKVETREEAVAAISKNSSVYTDTSVSNITVVLKKNVAIVRHLFKASEKKADGTLAPLNLMIMLVWVKETGKWRLMGRQAVKVT